MTLWIIRSSDSIQECDTESYHLIKRHYEWHYEKTTNNDNRCIVNDDRWHYFNDTLVIPISKVDKNPTKSIKIRHRSHGFYLLQAIRAQGVGVSQRGDPEGEMQGPFGWWRWWIVINGLDEGKILTGNHRFSHEIWDCPVFFPLNQ